eukprot:1142459-Pelagomonas_calceolata.AAC.1
MLVSPKYTRPSFGWHTSLFLFFSKRLSCTCTGAPASHHAALAPCARGVPGLQPRHDVPAVRGKGGCAGDVAAGDQPPQLPAEVRLSSVLMFSCSKAVLMLLSRVHERCYAGDVAAGDQPPQLPAEVRFSSVLMFSCPKAVLMPVSRVHEGVLVMWQLETDRTNFLP